MKEGFFYSSHRPPGEVTYRLKRQIVADFQPALAKATGVKKYWIRWLRSVALESRCNQKLYANDQLNQLVT
ncbi:hypothetical protein [Spirosoma luteum]|uniref:hypothetical protein n=1 Tax=Spirosoma luteum TaxID=431553 RepID=UPI0003761B7B|nr:hypothetical protein [Spirosoma luteum]